MSNEPTPTSDFQSQEDLALQGRLKRAFDTVEPSAQFMETLRGQIRQAHPPASPRSAAVYRFPRLLVRTALPAAAAVAAVWLLTVLVFPPMSAQAQLAAIHEGNVLHDRDPQLEGDEDDNYRSLTEPARAASYFQQSLGYVPKLPPRQAARRLLGCSTPRLADRVVASYLVGDEHRCSSVVVARLDASELGFREQVVSQGRTWFRCRKGDVNMISTQVGDYAYIAVCRSPHGQLKDMLSSIIRGEAPTIE